MPLSVRPINGKTDLPKKHRIPSTVLLKKTLSLALPFLIAIVASIVIYYRFQITAVENHARQMNAFVNRDMSLSIMQLLGNVKGDARMLASHPLLRPALENAEEDAIRQLSDQWTAIASLKRTYDQIRLLDARGMERIRINLTPEGAIAVGPDQLQNKGDRYYFREAMSLPAGTLYFSPLDLNIENGKIEQPIKPMLRIGITVTDGQGRKTGLVVLNYLAANLLTDLDAHGYLADSKTLLLNQQGYYLRGFDKADEWAFMFPDGDRSKVRFSSQYAPIWQQMQRARQGYLNHNGDIFNFQWLATDGDTSSATPYNREFVLVSRISAQHLATIEAPYRNAAWGAFFLALPTILIITALAARFRLLEMYAFECLREIEAEQRLILESVGEGIFGLDVNGRLVFANSRAAELTGFSPHEMLGHLAHNLIHMPLVEDQDHAADSCPLQISLQAGRPCHTDNDTFYRKNGDRFPVEYISSPIYRDGLLNGGVISFFDITERKNAENHIQYLVFNDTLTDMPNKSLLIERISQQLAAAHQTGQLAYLLYIDIDRFKQINDALGHERGDDILIEIARRLKSIAEEGDTIARYSSDEFVLLRTNVRSDADKVAKLAQLTADEIKQILAQPFLFPDDTIRLTASIGITLFPMADEDAVTILTQADTAVANAKAAGRNTTRFYKAEMEQATKDWLAVHNRMLEALASDSFNLVYQPKVSSAGHLIGLEALLRWNDRELGIVSPDRFVPVAEQSGLIVQLSDFVCAEVCRQIRSWIDSGLAGVIGSVAINISPVQFQEKRFVDNILGHITRSGVPPQAIELEITERTLVADIAETRNKLLALRKHGIRFSIDDFGTGYSSLAYLQQLPIDRLKIDRAFITDVHRRTDSQTIVEAIILMAKGLSIEVIAEGVEFENDLQYLVGAGCKEFQGYYFHKPLPVEETTILLNEFSAKSNGR